MDMHRRAMGRHTSSSLQGSNRVYRVPLGNINKDPLLGDGQPVFNGPSPWSKTGAYTVNATLLRGGKPMAVLNVGNKTESNIPAGAIIPYSQIHSIDNQGETNGRWTIVVNTKDKPDFYANLLEQAGFRLHYKVSPEIYSAVPLSLDYKIEYEIVTHSQPVAGSKGRSHRRRNRLNKTETGSIVVPAGRVQSLGYLIRVQMEKSAPNDIDSQTGLRKQDSYLITHRVTFSVGMVNGS